MEPRRLELSLERQISSGHSLIRLQLSVVSEFHQAEKTVGMGVLTRISSGNASRRSSAQEWDRAASASKATRLQQMKACYCVVATTKCQRDNPVQESAEDLLHAANRGDKVCARWSAIPNQLCERPHLLRTDTNRQRPAVLTFELRSTCLLRFSPPSLPALLKTPPQFQ